MARWGSSKVAWTRSPPVAGQGGDGGGVAVADLDFDADGFADCEAGDGDPVEAVGGEIAGHEIGVGAYGDLVGVGVDV